MTVDEESPSAIPMVPPTKAYSVGAVSVEAPLMEKLMILGQQSDSELSAILFAAWILVVSRLTAQDAVSVGVVRKENQGFTVHAFPVHVEPSSTLQLIDRVNQGLSADFSPTDAESAFPPQAAFYMHDVGLAFSTADRISLRCDLELHLLQDKGDLALGIRRASDLYYDGAIERYAGYLKTVLMHMTDNSSHPVDSFDILSPEEKHLRETWNQTDAEYPDRCIHHFFEDQVESSPEAIAVVHNEHEFTYAELNVLATRLAFQLVKAGVKHGDSVAMLLERSVEMIATQLAVLKTGAAYVCIDPRAPLERQAFILKDSGAVLLVTHTNTEVPSALELPLHRLDIFVLQATDTIELEACASCSSSDTAYVMYTSGSTGVPKAVVVPHRAIACRVFTNGFADIESSDRVAFATNPSHVPSTFDIWATFVRGARMVIMDNDIVLDPHRLAAALVYHQVTSLYMTNPLLHQYAFIIGDTLSTLKYLIGGADLGTTKAYSAVLNHGGPVRMVHRFGSTETPIGATAYIPSSNIDQMDHLPIGRPVPNIRCYVLDQRLMPAPIGVIGELYIGGSGIATHYLHRPDITAERFLSDPFSNVPGAHMYKTGDMVRYLPDGNLVFIGRNDFQVKIRGYRIELGEIESRLVGHELVKSAAVLGVGDGDGKRLVAYVAAAPNQHLADILHQYLALNLPEYMIPAAFVQLDELPLTIRGKIDRSALPVYDFASSQEDYAPPQGDMETMLAALWSEFLKVERVGRNSNFFMLGGHSLIAIRMIERLRRLGYSMSVRTLFETPVLHTLASSLREHQASPAAPPNLITPTSTTLTPEMLPLISLTQDDIDNLVNQVPGGVANIQDIYSLSPLQEGILFHHMMAKEADPYLITVCTAFRNRELLDHYLSAFQKVVDRHDILRTAFLWENMSTPAQVVLRHVSLPVMEHSLDLTDGPVVDQLMRIYNPRNYRLNLSTAPLIQLATVQDNDGRWVLLELHHHIIGDRSTTEALQEEIMDIIKGGFERLPAAEPYRNLIAEARLRSVSEEEDFFRKMLQDFEIPSLLYGKTNIYSDGCDVTDFHCLLPQDLNTKLRGHARRLGVSLASLCHLAWARVIGSLSGQDQVVFGTVLFGRMQGGAGSDRALGLFVNTLPFRIDVGEISVQESVRKVQADLAALLQHEHASLGRAQRQSGVPMGMPLFNALLNYRHNTAPDQEKRASSGIETIATHDRTNYPFTMSVEDYGSSSSTSLGLAVQVLQPYDPVRICSYMQQALENLAQVLENSPQSPVQAVGILPEDEHDLLIHAWNNTEASYPSDVCVHQLFENQAKSSTEVTAVVHNDRSMTYGKLNAYGNRIARRLAAAGVKEGDHVAIMLDRSIDHVAVQIAILKTGAAYVPIDTKAPVERQAYIASDSGVKLLVTDERTVIPAQIEVPVLRLGANEDNVEGSDSFDSARTSTSSTAYIMYTSGSTGRPKGVLVPHRGIARLFFNNALATIGPGDCMAFASNPAFDQSVYEIWAPLLTGARLVVIDHDTFLDPHRLAETLVYHQVTFLRLTNAVIQQYGGIIGDTFSKLKYLIGAGEQGSLKGYSAIVEHGGPVCLINSLGTTETTVDATMYVATSAINQLDRLPIGRPISNTRLYVLDKNRKPAPLDVTGELFIGGPGVANGYLNRPDLTAERFLLDPFSNVPGARMYRTGDLARWLPDGNLIYLGRDDFQVKIRGFRIELGEIEERLCEHPQVHEAVVLATGEAGDKRLVAYVMAAPDDKLATNLRDHIGSCLPEYMIPSAFVRMDVFPLNNNGKVDRRALPDPDNSSFVTNEYSEPEGDIECALADMWTEMLKVERVGRHDNFFALGGHSLLAVRLMNRLSTTLRVQVPLSTLYQTPTLSGLAELLSNSIAQDMAHMTISRVNRADPLELSFAQQRLWFLAQMDGVSATYHVPVAIRLLGTLNKDALQKALNSLLVRHEALRMVFVPTNGLPKIQLLPADTCWTLASYDLGAEKDKEAVFEQLKAQEVSLPFDLEKGPLVRALLIQFGEKDQALLFTLHHIIVDGWSLGVLFQDLSELYASHCSGMPESLAPLSIQYPDYAAWQRQQLTEDRLEDQAAYWRETLAGAPVTIALPTDRQRPRQQSFVGGSVPIRLDVQLTSALQTLCQKHGVTMFMTVLAAWSAVLSRLSGQDDIVIGTPVANRNHPQIEQLIGFFVNTLALRIDLSGEPNAEQIINRVRKTTIAAQSHQDMPFEQVVEIVQPPRRMDQTPIFQVLLAWQNSDIDSLQLQDLEAIPDKAQYDISKFDLELFIGEENDQIAGSLRYSTALFDHQTVERHVGYLEAMLRWMTRVTEQCVGEAPILGSLEQKLLLETWNNTNHPYPDSACIHHLFERQAKASPEAIAIVQDDRSMTYRELDSRANWIAHQLVAAGVDSGDNVAILLERSIDLVASQIAILKVGAAYVPIDNKAPVDRKAYMVADSGAKLLVTDKTTIVPDQIEAVVLRLSMNMAEDLQDRVDSYLSKSSLDTAYVMYTSGSTGLPKGVMVSHRGIARLTINNGWFNIGPGDRVAFGSNTTFDLSTLDVWTPLLNGGCIVVFDQDTVLNAHQLEVALERYQVNALQLPTAIFHQYAFVIGSALSRLKYLLFAGEQGLIEACTEVLRHGGPVRLINAYGPTETVYTTSYAITDAVSLLDRLPIGQPINNTRLYVLDKYSNPVPLGVIGELYVAGPGVANGYRNRPDLTAERFLPDLFSNDPDAKMYRTGDLVRYLADGNTVYIGRTDFQVKIRGFRIEIGEIEARLAEHPRVREVVVLAIGESGDKRLVAYVVASPFDNFVSTLRDYLTANLPEYMVPSAFVRLDVMPLTNNGKADRRALPEPDSDSFVTETYVSPEGEIEVTLASLWAALLKVGRVGRYDNFFMLGGHSLLAVRLVNRLSTTLGVQLSLSAIFQSPTLSGLAEVIKNHNARDDLLHSKISPAERGGPLELSFAQQRLWFLAQLDGVSETYRVPVARRLRGNLNRNALQQALDSLFARHESLRSRFVNVSDQPKVLLLPADSGLPLVFHDLRNEQDKEVLAKRLAVQEAAAPFDLEKGPLVRSQLIQIAEEEHVFQLTMHHITTDGWSLGVLFQEVNELYAASIFGQPDPLAPLSIQYPDYAAWQRQQLTEDRLEDLAAYWRKTLAGAPVTIALPTDRQRPRQQSFAGESVPIRLDVQLTSALQTLCQKHGVTMFMTILAAWSAVLSRLSGQDDIVIGTPVANRNHPQIEQLIGFFVNTLALRIDLSGEPNAEQIIDRVRKTTIAAQSHQDMPFEQVVEIVQPPRRMDQTPIFQVMFTWQNKDLSSLQLQDVEASIESTQYDLAKFDLSLELHEEGGEIIGIMQYSTALFDGPTIERHMGYLKTMLRWMTANTEGSIDQTPILEPSEHELLVHTWNATDRPYPDNTCIHRLFESQVKATPDAIAIVHADCSVTYGELNSRANWIASQLVAAGVSPGDHVLIQLNRSVELVAAEIAILKAGAVYVPLDPNIPEERQIYIAIDCAAKLVVTDEETNFSSKKQLPQLRLGSYKKNVDTMPDFIGSASGISSSSYDTAYVMYTSGSTGLPKGVMVSHRGIARLAFNNGFADIVADDHVAFSSNPSFDPSTFEVWVPLLNGARIVIIDRETFLDPHRLAESLLHYQVTFLHMTNALLHQYAFIIGEPLSKLRYLTGAAEQGSIEAYNAVLQHGGPVQVINRYGPTEATVDVTAYVATSCLTSMERLPIGPPVGNTRVYVLDKYLVPVPIGVAGELYIGGPGVANGYLNRPELTAKCFVPDPFSNVPGARMYKTGDLVRHLSNGELVFLGRRDNQIKIRGYRVELGEIEVRLVEHPDVREAVVVVTGEGVDKRLVAYVVSAPQDSLARTLREHLSAALPEYMVPSAFVRLNAMPLNSNGKVDRRSLPEPDSSFFVTEDYVAPIGDIETTLASVWSLLLKIERVGRDDNFFMLGGHSLLATRLLNRVSTSLGVQLPLSTLFQSPTLSALAEVVQKSISHQDLTHSTITPTPRDGLLELSFAQQRLWFLTRMEGMSEIYHVPIALRFHGALNQFILGKALNALYARHESLRSSFVVVSGQPKVRILPPDNGLLLVINDLRQEQDREAIAKEIAVQEGIAPFDLEKGPLVRARLIQLAEDSHVFLLTMHHITTDGWSMSVLFRELSELYTAYVKSQPDPLTPLAIQYPDYAVWQRQQLTEDRLQDRAAYWRKTLAGAPVTIALPTDRQRPRQQSFVGGSVPIRLDVQLTSALQTLCQKHGVTMFMTVLAAWSAVLSRLSGQDDIVIGTPVANRNHPQIEQLIGFFVNTLALRIDLSGEPNAEQIINRVRKTTIAAQSHQDMPFEQVVEIVQPPRRMDQTPIFQVMLAWQNRDIGSLQLQDLEAVPDKLQYDISKFDLELFIGEENDQITGSLRYSTALFDHQTVERHVGYLEAMLRWMTRVTEQCVGEAPILGSLEQKLLLETWNNTNHPYPDSACIHHLFERQAKASPEAIAIVQDDRSMTYRELDSRANWIAHQLVAAGVDSGDNVAILLERSIDLVASQIAILKVGAAYVPIDNKAPVDRKAYMVADSGAKLLVTDKTTIVPDQIEAVVLRLSMNMAEDLQDRVDSYLSKSSLDTAYVMYTSGSTGLPKGVMVSHRGIARLAFNNGFADIVADDHVAFSSNPSFDPSTFEVWVPLLNGARIVIIDRETFLDPHRLAESLLHYQVTFLHMTNALLHQYAFIIGEPLSKLRYLTGAAEQGSIEAYNAVLQHGGPVQVINRYGPTEATVDVTAYVATSCLTSMERLPIGPPVGNSRVYVLDKHLIPVPIGVAGELYIGGPGVANGYLNRPELTAKCFVPDPFSNVPGARMYKTGDLVRHLSNGELVFLGRRDNQIKIRGYRVELGEIEVRLVEHPDVREAVVVVTGEGADKQLVAYVVSAPQDSLARTLREHLSAALPEYMVPSAFVRLNAMPLNNNGKVDHRALPTPDPSSFVGRDYEVPQGNVEIALADVWASLLRIERVGRHDNFFMLGGHSLLAVKMIEQLRCLGYTLSVRALFDNAVLHTLAASIGLYQPGPEIPQNLITPTTVLTPDVLPLINLTQDDIDTIVNRVPGGAANIQDIYELSPLQEGILFHHLLATEGDPYLTMVCSAFHDRVLLDRYLDALQKVVDRHDILRTAIMWENMSTPAQVVLRNATLSVMEHSLNPADGPIIDQLKRLYDPRKHHMDLSLAPLTRFAFARDSDGRWIMLQLIHHSIGDHSTQEVMDEEVKAILDGDGNNLPVPQQFRNLIAQARLGISAEEHDRFFRNMLQDVDTPSLPFELSDVYNSGVNVIESHKRLPQELNHRLRGHAKRLGVSLATICHLAWAKVISSLCGQDRVVFGTVLFGRMQGGSGSDRAMGLFINTLPFRADVDGANILNSVRKVQADLAALLEHEHASLARAQRLSGVPSGMPLFSSLLNYRHNVAPVQAKQAGNGMQHIEAQERDNYPLAMSIEDFEHSLGLTAQVVQSHDPSRICDFMHQALESIANALEQPSETPIQRMHILPAEEYELVVHSWNETDAPFPSDRCLHQLFEDQVERSPSAVAVMQGHLSVTYGALNTKADQLAGTLIDMGVQPGDNVALLLSRSVELIVAQVAIVKAGAAYVPIDVKAPASRQAYILSDSGAKLLLTDDSTQVHDQIQTPVLRFSVNSDLSDGVQAKTIQHKPTSSSHTACVMYTSGSTGLPKGVLVPHRAIVCRLLNNGCTVFTADDCIAFVNNPSFDPSTSDVWGSLLYGARIAIIDNDTLLDANLLSAALDRYQITSLDMPSALFHQYAYIIGPALSKLRYLVCGGEQGSIEAFLAVVQQGGPVRIFNAYGPTETTVNASMYEITSAIEELERLPIGRPISNTRVYVLDKHLVPAPIGVAGELYIGGPGVANGYLNRPELTAECFVSDPFSNVPGARMYKTGDLVRHLSNGELVFLGRRDNQIKIRGYRVELGEIEVRLEEHPDVREAVVVVTGEGTDKRLVAYIVVSAPAENFAIKLRQDLSARLPEYMVPSAFVCMDVLPLTSNGKVDRNALPNPDSASFVVGEYVAPQGGDEVALAAIWCEFLKLDRIGRHDDFFMLGGHSLLALRMIGAVRTRLGMDLKLQSLFSAPSIAELVQTMQQDSVSKNQDDEYGVLLPLKTRGNRLPLFCIHPAFGMSWSYRGLMPHLHPEQPLYGLQARGLDGKTPLANSIEEMTLDYIDQIRKVQPHGPYNLLGWSFGGTVAHNMAVEFEKRGEQVSLLAIMDSLAEYSRLTDADLDDEEKHIAAQEFSGLFAAGMDSGALVDAEDLQRRMLAVSTNNSRLAIRHSPSVVSGGIAFLRAAILKDNTTSLIDPATWKPLALGEIEVHDVQCTHEEMNLSEHIAVVGRIVAARLEEQ